MLSVSSLAYTTEAMTLYHTLEATSFRSADYIYISSIFKQINGNSVTQIQFLFKTCELGQVSLGSSTSFLKVSHKRSARVFLLSFLEAELHGCITIFLHTLNLSYYTRTSFDNSAWNILSIGTEYGCHSDFLS